MGRWVGLEGMRMEVSFSKYRLLQKRLRRMMMSLSRGPSRQAKVDMVMVMVLVDMVCLVPAIAAGIGPRL
jgi:hypothetical protein